MAVRGRDWQAEQALARYRSWLAGQPLARSTRVSYGTKVSRFVRWMGDCGPDDIRSVYLHSDPERLLRDFALHLKDKGCLVRTVNAHLAAVNSFYRFLGLTSPTGVWQQPDAQDSPRTLSTEEQRRLLSVTMDRSRRDFAVVVLGLFAGLRLAELSAVDVEDVELTDADGQVAIGQHSTGVGRVVPLNTQARAAVGAWLVERSAWPGSETTALLLSRRGLRLSVRAVDLVVRTCGTRAGLQVSTQVLQHTFVDNLYRVGTNVATVAQLAGYHRPETVRRYRPCGLGDGMLAVEAISVDI